MMTREQFVTEALTWDGTPYVRNGRIKGVGCDCGSFLAELYTSCGLMTVDEIEATMPETGSNTRKISDISET